MNLVMGFNYNRHKENEQHGSAWTSYSDLFMGLSFVFLLLYVTASLRSGTSGIQQQLQMQKITMENEDLKNQLKVYNSIKNNYVSEEASQSEEKLYGELMDKLDLLQDQARAEKEKLQEAALDNEKKERALNKYQQLVRNIVNANVVAKSRIKKRDDIIVQQDDEISTQETQIADMEKTIRQKKNQIAMGETKIREMNEALDKRMKELRWAYKNQKMTQKKYESEVNQIKESTRLQVSEFKSKNAQYEEQINAMNQELESTQKNLSATESQKQALQNKLAGTEKEFAEKEAQLRADYAAQRARDQANHEKELNQQKLSAAERAAKEAAYRAQLAKKEKDLENQISGLQGKLAGTEAQLAKVKAERDARHDIAKEIKKGFQRAGISAEVDGETGDVTIDFGDNYFDTGRSDMKPEMAAVLRKAMPIYSKSLMENKKISSRISAVEIVGFASPTYRGRYVDPNSMDAEDKKAVEFNLDLSYQRAKSIFQYAFDPKHISFEHQKQLRPLVKVSGKSFFEAAKINREVASSVTAKDFCKQFDCKKSQRVLIRFSIDPKK